LLIKPGKEESTMTNQPLLSEEQSGETSIPFEPGFLNIPIYVAVHDRNENDLGASQIEVFFSALFAYRRHVKANHLAGQDKETTLVLIDELLDTALGEVYTRLSESAAILHSLKHKLPS
jgi:hypothetical protein